VVRALVRHAPHDADAWQQQLTVDLIEHESGHVRFSGTKPSGTLGWLWNVLEDARQERLMALAVPEDRERFERLGDAAWLGCEPTSDLLAWCLLWRWEATHVPGSPQAAQSKMEYTHADWQLWELAIRPLVERAWAASSSDDVTAIAEAILDLLGRDADAAPPALGWCVAHGRRSDAPDAITTGDEGSGETELPPLPGGSGGAGRGQGLLPGEADPVLVLTEVEGAARAAAGGGAGAVTGHLAHGG
jgi:hypothetical protein